MQLNNLQTNQTIFNFQLPLLVILAGQSNAGGFGTNGNDVPIELQGQMNDVYFWRDLEIGSGPPNYGFALYNAGINSDPVSRTSPCKWGAEAEFARQFKFNFPNVKLFIVKSAASGSQLENSNVFLGENSPSNDWHPDSIGELFDKTSNSIPDIINSMSSFNILEFNSLFLWMQGESDASYIETSLTYHSNLIKFINAIRNEFGLGSIPCILGRIQPLSWIYNGPVRMAMAKVAAGEIENVKMVNTDDCQLLPDNKHYNAIGQQLLGLKYWQAYSNTMSATAISLPPTFEWTIEEQGANQTIIGKITPINLPNPSATFEFISGQTTGFALDYNSGALSINDGTKLVFATNPSREFIIKASNGVNTVTTTVTITLTERLEVTDIQGTLIRFDPNDSNFYTLVSGKYSVLVDTRGSGKTITQSNSSRRPIQTIFPGSNKLSIDCNNLDGTFDSMTFPPDSSLFNDTHTEVTIGVVIHPVSGLTGIKNICGIFTGSSNGRFSIYYDYTNQKFGMIILNSKGTTNSPSTVNTFAPNTTYRVRGRKVGTSIQLFVNDIEQTLSSIGTPKSTILNSGEVGGFVIGGNGLLAGAYLGYIGLGRVIRGNLNNNEINFLNNELESWTYTNPITIIDWEKDNYLYKNLISDTSFSFVNNNNKQNITIITASTGNYKVTWPTNIIWPNSIKQNFSGTNGSPTIKRSDIWNFIQVNNTIRGNYISGYYEA